MSAPVVKRGRDRGRANRGSVAGSSATTAAARGGSTPSSTDYQRSPTASKQQHGERHYKPRNGTLLSIGTEYMFYCIYEIMVVIGNGLFIMNNFFYIFFLGDLLKFTIPITIPITTLQAHSLF